MLPSEELLQSIDILAQNAVKDSVKIYTAIVTAVGDNDTCSVRVNGKTHSNIVYYGDVPTVNKSYRVFCPNGSMNQAFIITGGGSSGGGSTGATDYNQLTNRPSINGTTLSGNKTSSQLGLYGTNNTPPYPVTSVNGQTGDVVISTGGNVDSVNGKTGVVVLNADDVGALPDTTVIPSKTSQLDNDSGFITDIPIASATQLGGVKIGAGLSVTENGVLSATGGGTADAVEWNNVLDKPTTIAGYGITDAKIENGTITLGNQTITPLTSAPVTSVNGHTGAVTVHEVPTVTTSDNGKFLRVVNGAWAAVAIADANGVKF